VGEETMRKCAPLAERHPSPGLRLSSGVVLALRGLG
jgi:hypothetical protein